MTDILTATEGFMRGAQQGFAVPDVEDVRGLRVRILVEEHREYQAAENVTVHEDGSVTFHGPMDPVETADALLDQIVVAWGTGLTYFGPELMRELAAEVARSNLAKVDGTYGPTQFREDGKVKKPEGWQPPDLRSIMRRHGWDV